MLASSAIGRMSSSGAPLPVTIVRGSSCHCHWQQHHDTHLFSSSAAALTLQTVMICLQTRRKKSHRCEEPLAHPQQLPDQQLHVTWHHLVSIDTRNQSTAPGVSRLQESHSAVKRAKEAGSCRNWANELTC